MSKKTLTLSIVIPVYNEQDYLVRCLDAIAKQSQSPDEVIVVDNNSTDSSALIAQSYDFVTLLQEPSQGTTFARNSGFQHATSKIIARIDADTQIAPDWCEKLHQIFSNTEVNAVTGPGILVFVPFLHRIKNTFWVSLYHYGARAYFRHFTLWGANMAIRKSIWERVKEYTSPQNSLAHEDQDISIVLHILKYKTHYRKDLLVEAGAERFWNPPKLWKYYRRSLATVKRAKDLQKQVGSKPEPEISIFHALIVRVLVWPPMVVFFLLATAYKPFSRRSN